MLSANFSGPLSPSPRLVSDSSFCVEKRAEELKDRIDALEDELKEYRQKYEIREIERTLDNVRDEKNVLYHDKASLILREKNLDALRKKVDAVYDSVMGVVTELDSPNLHLLPLRRA